MIDNEEEKPSLFDRLIAAIIAPIVFNFCVITTIAFWYSFLPRRTIYFFNPFRRLIFLSGEFILAISIILPIVAGFLLGLTRFGNLIGILFPFGTDDNPNYIKTIFAWILLTLYAYIYAKILS